MSKHYTYVVVGGGIAGVTCVETLAFLDEQSSILLITSSDIVKAASSAIQVTKTLVELNVEEIEAKKILGKYENVEVMTDVVVKLNYPERIVETGKNKKISFSRLCLCTGGKPNVIFPSNPNVIGIRDTESVVDFQKRIKSARRILIVGNGGIASEVVYEVKSVEKIWVVKDDHISKTFIDGGAGEFFRNALYNTDGSEESTIVKRLTFTTETTSQECSGMIPNPALGPDWHRHCDLTGAGENNSVIVEFNAEVTNITKGTENWPVKVYLTNGKDYQVDFVVSATGVSPNTEVFTNGNKNLKIAEDGGILVDWKMETSLPDVFAAGDVCTAGWEPAEHWLQMRLWTQARQMGAYSAKAMVASLNKEEILQDFCFEIFSHVTKLFGYKVILLGLFNAQKFIDKYELLVRMTKGKEYVKLVLKDGKMQGALLIGETDLEEMCENLILNQIDLTPYGEDLLNPDIDIEDYFD